jgi:hypothetical protein
MTPVRISRRNAHGAVALTAAVLLVVALAVAMSKARGTEERFCTTEGLIGPNGHIYGRDPNHGCKFVDENGKDLPGQDRTAR